jgi:hypothetical protein
LVLLAHPRTSLCLVGSTRIGGIKMLCETETGDRAVHLGTQGRA